MKLKIQPLDMHEMRDIFKPSLYAERFDLFKFEAQESNVTFAHTHTHTIQC